jgi:Uma2 family endonuclease
MVAPAASHKILTYEEYLEEFQTQPPSQQPSYIIDGEVIMPPSPRRIHQAIIHNLDVLLGAFASRNGAIRVFPSPMDVVIRKSPLRVRQPDLLVMSEARCELAGGIDADGPITVAPEMVVEVLSPSETRKSIDDKIADFQEIGVRECWIVNSDNRTVEVLSLESEQVRSVATYGVDQSVPSISFESLTLCVADIFKK